MWNKLLFGLLLCFSFSALHADNGGSLTYSVQKKKYPFSTVFELATPKSMVGTVVKSAFHVRTHYDLYDAKGVYRATAICRILTLGLLYDWGTEMDVYDPSGNYLGMIDGQAVTGASAKFSFYDGRSNHVAIAYLDQNHSGFTLLNPINEYHTIAQYTRRFVEDAIDPWDVSIFDADEVPNELLHIFSAFAVDRQGAFKIDR